ncbi:MAG: glycoside hydrolase family 140 protein [Bryobacteraceae bacterium]|nr:glycoside hydrolase family 140 protein [Bryobacteraceae bacterium]
MRTLAVILAGLSLAAAAPDARGAEAAGASVKGLKLQVSANGRYLQERGGKPFFYLGDTAWTLFKRLTREEADEYLRNRAAKGFTVIQAYVLRGLTIRNVYGDLTVVDRDPTRFNEPFFQNVDWIVNRANELGLVMSLVVSYGEHVNGKQEKVFNESNAYQYGKLLAARYKDNAVIWLLGGDRNPQQETGTWSAMARGLKDGSGHTQLVSYHGPGPRTDAGGPTGYSSSFWFHDQDWLDFNMIQSGHRWAVKNYDFIAHDYELKPVKPTIDMEARYENHPDGPNPRRMDAHQEREATYWAMLAGAAGHGYGCNDIWQFYNPERMPAQDDNSFPFDRLRGTTHWKKAMDFEGAFSMGTMRRLLEARPWYNLVPDQSAILAGQGEDEDRVQAARAADGSFLLAYLTFGNPVTIDLEKLSGRSVRAHWYDPRTGALQPIGEFPKTGSRQFKPPAQGPAADWALVLEDRAKKLAKPASR